MKKKYITMLNNFRKSHYKLKNKKAYIRFYI